MGENWLAQCCQRQPVLYHSHASLLDPRFAPDDLAEQTQFTQSAWLSLHLDVPSGRVFNWHKRLGCPLALISQQQATQLAYQNIHALQHYLQVPLALENQAYHRASGHNYVTDPQFMRDIITATATYLLLDLGHARVSAAMWQMPIEEYLQALPLDRVIEIHINGPRIYRGRLRDVHAPLQDIDYELLRFVIAHTPQVQVVTLEYYGAKQILLTQLKRLQSIITENST